MTVYTANETIGSKNEGINLSNNAKKVLVLIKPDPSITKTLLSANLNVSKATVERAFDELKQV